MQRNQRIHSGSGFFGSFDAPWSEKSWIDLFSKETQNPFSDSFGFKNPILDFLKETHPKVCTVQSTQYDIFKYFLSFLLFSLSGYGFMDIGLPPASPSDKDIDLKVHSFDFYKHALLIFIAEW